ncbi:MAG: holdfast anchoring protein HfaA [Maricaulaceae bacterium]|nr:holdfast anchoring protein HfaA [Maricaulaceae bacterium]
MTLRLKALLPAVAAAALTGAPAAAQNAGDFERPWGTQPGDQSQPYRAGTRDANNNRVVLNGVIQTGSGVQAQMSGVGASHNSQNGAFNSNSATAIGNQLNVVVQGNWNTVVVNSTQTNNGTVTATAGGAGANANGND